MQQTRIKKAIAAGILALGLAAASNASAGFVLSSSSLNDLSAMSEVDKLRLELMAEIDALKAQLAEKVSLADFDAHSHEYVECSVDFYADAEGDAHILDSGCSPHHTLPFSESYFD